ncbi:TPM domain-containing protein [Chthonobacter rhizosphaerae]|uniref:TPM domain-containing protein n=1 Tax=Chthonobacter rhizosphaerae TaxID=2735553 RepID=UPI0015EFB3A8|nr:TPM domain-containing protein [Chthonobacter rhizosphaerae]
MTAAPFAGRRARPVGAAALTGVLLAGLVLALVALAAPALAQVPPLTGRVVDAAGVLPADVEARLTGRLEAMERTSGDQLVVATLPSLGERPIEDVAVEAFRTWGLGQKEENNGVLLLVAPTERRVRIEVGYGLEGVLTDATARMIIETDILPRFRDGDLPGGVVAGAEAIAGALSGDAADLAERVAAYEARERQAERVETLMVFGVFGLVAAIMIWRVVADWIWPERRARRLARRRERAMRDPLWPNRGSRTGSRSSDRRSGGFRGGGGSSGGGGASGGW